MLGDDLVKWSIHYYLPHHGHGSVLLVGRMYCWRQVAHITVSQTRVVIRLVALSLNGSRIIPPHSRTDHGQVAMIHAIRYPIR